MEIGMDEDSLRCILKHTCCINARRHARPLEARLAVGEDSSLIEVDPNKVICANGIIGSKETILFDVTLIDDMEIGAYPTLASQMVKWRQETQNPGDLVFVDTLGDESGLYDDERSLDGQDWKSVGDGPWLFPCLGWGSRKRVRYSLCLSRALSVSIEFDVYSVPTSWWVDDCEGTFWVVQLIDAGYAIPLPLALSSYGYSKTQGYEVVGWTSV
jgi:hypothetical protein